MGLSNIKYPSGKNEYIFPTVRVFPHRWEVQCMYRALCCTKSVCQSQQRNLGIGRLLCPDLVFSFLFESSSPSLLPPVKRTRVNFCGFTHWAVSLSPPALFLRGHSHKSQRILWIILWQCKTILKLESKETFQLNDILERHVAISLNFSSFPSLLTSRLCWRNSKFQIR